MAAEPQNFQELRSALYVRWAQRPRVGAFLGALAAQRDEVVSAVKDAARVNFPALCHDSALDAAGASRALVRAPGESHSSFRAYLQTAWDVWYTAGRRSRMLAELARLGYTNAQIWGYWELVAAGFPSDMTFGRYSSFFFVLIKPPHPVTRVIPEWGGADQYKGGARWGVAFTRTQQDALRNTIQKWKPAGTSCRFVALDFDGDALVVAPKWGDPNWGAFKWGAGISGTEYQVLPLWEDWELLSNGGRKEFYNYSPIIERVK